MKEIKPVCGYEGCGHDKSVHILEQIGCNNFSGPFYERIGQCTQCACPAFQLRKAPAPKCDFVEATGIDCYIHNPAQPLASEVAPWHDSRFFNGNGVEEYPTILCNLPPEQMTAHNGKVNAASTEPQEAIECPNAPLQKHSWKAATHLERCVFCGDEREPQGAEAPAGRNDTAVKLWCEYRMGRKLPMFNELPVNTQLYAQYIIGSLTAKPQPKSAEEIVETVIQNLCNQIFGKEAFDIGILDRMREILIPALEANLYAPRPQEPINLSDLDCGGCGDGGCIQCCPSNFTEKALIEEMDELREAIKTSQKPSGELISAVESLLEWVPKSGKGSSGYLRVERVKAALQFFSPAQSPQPDRKVVRRAVFLAACKLDDGTHDFISLASAPKKENAR